MNIPNMLTVSRLLMLPFILIALFIPGEIAAVVALTLYIVGAVTDFLDGYIARLTKQTSAVGKFLDPIADKIYVVAILFALVGNDTISGLFITLPVIILVREFMVSGLREFLGPNNVSVSVTWLGKAKTATQMIALGVLIGAPIWEPLFHVGMIILLLATLLTVYSGWDYLKKALPHFTN
ncbi:MAG: CDP-diacylglycerol--glycerol-3-phosphate 3-phosphatidyltransferase [Alphaproteobacteria bacterium]|nr:CDP-diacylglycerol--glycerol-3-phosphate 3-phosphatidyltransferase [Alphaproteobacteria bacterium]